MMEAIQNGVLGCSVLSLVEMGVVAAAVLARIPLPAPAEKIAHSSDLIRRLVNAIMKSVQVR